MAGPSWADSLLAGGQKPRNPISRARLERIAGRTVAAFGLIFGLQTLPIVLSQLGTFKQPWGLIAAGAVYGGVLAVIVCAVIQRWVRGAMGYFAISYLLVVVAWPFTVIDPNAHGDKPWVWFLCTVATAYATIAFRLSIAIAYTILTPIAYGVIRATPSGGGVSIGVAALDTVYATILGGVILVIITMLRQAASAVDDAQTTALERYANAVRQHATEVERVQVDSIVHDSVLATLLSASNARTSQAMAIAATMAADAIRHLHAAEAVDPEDQSLVGLDRLSERIRAAATAFSSPFDVTVTNVTSQTLPVHVAEAVYSATVQAMVNSLQHAGGRGVSRSLVIAGGGSAATVSVSVSDTGVGFEARAVSSERLGLRVSIIERLTKVGGEARIDSQPGKGATVTLIWPAPLGHGGYSSPDDTPLTLESDSESEPAR
jgi:signal transduction histidine kinase